VKYVKVNTNFSNSVRVSMARRSESDSSRFFCERTEKKKKQTKTNTKNLKITDFSTK